jgi:hypothetical protein
MTNGNEADAELEPDSIFGIDLDGPVEYWTEIHFEAEGDTEQEIEDPGAEIG